MLVVVAALCYGAVVMLDGALPQIVHWIIFLWRCSPSRVLVRRVQKNGNSGGGAVLGFDCSSPLLALLFALARCGFLHSATLGGPRLSAFLRWRKIKLYKQLRMRAFLMRGRDSKERSYQDIEQLAKPSSV